MKLDIFEEILHYMKNLLFLEVNKKTKITLFTGQFKNNNPSFVHFERNSRQLFANEFTKVQKLLKGFVQCKKKSMPKAFALVKSLACFICTTILAKLFKDVLPYKSCNNLGSFPDSFTRKQRVRFELHSEGLFFILIIT